MKRFLSLANTLVCTSALVLSVSCSKKDDDKDKAGNSNNTNTGSLALSSDLGTAYPESLAISVFPETVDAEAASAGTIAASLTTQDEAPRTLRQKVEIQKQLLSGQAASCVPAALQNRQPKTVDSCYQFDQDMMFGYGPNGTATSGTHNGKNSLGEACLVSFARTEVDGVVNLVEETTGYVEAAICQSIKDNASATLPAVGEQLDLKGPLQTALGARANGITSATMDRLADVDARAIFKTSIEIVDLSGNTRKIEIAHSPAADGTNDTFNGRLTLEMDGDVGGVGPGDKKRLLSVQYARIFENGEYRVQYELRTARMIAHVASQAFENGILNLNASTNAAGNYVDAAGVEYSHNGGAESIRYVSFDMNPDTNVGTLSYWQNPGQNYTEATRGLVFNLSVDDQGKYRGCANSGAVGSPGNGVSIRKALKDGDDLQPNGSYHPFHNKENMQQGCTLAADGVADSAGTYYQKNCTMQTPQGPQNQVAKWYRPKVSDAAAATEFASKQHSGLITRQCYVQAADGSYQIDTAEINEAAGYELIRTTDTTKIIGKPSINLPPPPVL